MATGRSAEWSARPLLSRLLRAVVLLVPIGASWAIAIVVSRALPPANSVSTAVLWVAFIGAASLLTLVVFERAARRLMPLAALLDVSLLFPDRAPARFAVARASGNPRDLRARLQRALDAGADEDARSMQTVIELCLALSVHDRATRGHSERVRVFTDMIAAELGVPEDERALLRWAAILHDIGKLEVASAILNKDGRPTDAEWEELHRHPAEGARLVAPLLPWLGEWGSAVLQHHERMDGRGYPYGLPGEGMSLAARIVAVADAYEVMTAPRSYKRPMSVVAARRELVAAAGSQLDPEVVRAFLNVSVGRLWRVIGVAAWLGQLPTMGRFASGVVSWATPAVATVVTVTVVAAGGSARVAAGGGLVALPPPLAAACPTLSAPSATAAKTATAAPSPTASPLSTPTASARPSPTATATASSSPAGIVPLPVTTPTPSATALPAATPSTSPSPAPGAPPSPSPGCR